MKKRLFLFSIIILSACSASIPDVPQHEISTAQRQEKDALISPKDDDGNEKAEVTSTPEKKQNSPLEQVPSELSIEHFSRMQLEGTNLSLEYILDDNDTYTRYRISYISNGLTITGIMNIPNGDGPFPLVLLNHGFISPVIYTNGRGLKREQDYLARRGFAVLHSDYRGHAESDPSPDTRNVYDAGLEYSMDVLNAIHSVRSANLPTVDASHVGMLGHSLGGGVTLNAAVAFPEMIDAIVLYAPVHADAWENFMRWRDMRDEGDNTRAALGTRSEQPEHWNKLSSQTYLNNIDDPILLFHGANDTDVPKQWSDDLAQRLQALEKDFTYIEYEKEKHEFIAQWNDSMEKTAAFFREHLLENDDQHTSHPLIHPDRITKKPFGIFITQQNSPVQPERFSGYHTGMDFEVLDGEQESDLFIPAICKGVIREKTWIDGYGGVIIQNCAIADKPVTVLYGHLSLTSVGKDAGDVLAHDEIIGHLGEAFSEETDGERAHLHLAIHKGTEREMRGYIQTEEGLQDWVDPLSF